MLQLLSVAQLLNIISLLILLLLLLGSLLPFELLLDLERLLNFSIGSLVVPKLPWRMKLVTFFHQRDLRHSIFGLIILGLGRDWCCIRF